MATFDAACADLPVPSRKVQANIVRIKGFNNFEELVEYKSLLAGDNKLHLPPSVRHVMISVDNFNLLVNEGRSLEEYFIYLEQLNQARGDVMMDEENDTGPNDDESPDQ